MNTYHKDLIEKLNNSWDDAIESELKSVIGDAVKEYADKVN